MVAYVAKFLPWQSQIAALQAVLRGLLCEEAVWSWTPAQNDTFQLLKMTSTAPRFLHFIPKSLQQLFRLTLPPLGLERYCFKTKEMVAGLQSPTFHGLSRLLKRGILKSREMLSPWLGRVKNFTAICLEARPRETSCSYGRDEPQTLAGHNECPRQLDECPPRLISEAKNWHDTRYCYTVEYVPGMLPMRSLVLQWVSRWSSWRGYCRAVWEACIRCELFAACFWSKSAENEMNRRGYSIFWNEVFFFPRGHSDRLHCCLLGAIKLIN